MDYNKLGDQVAHYFSDWPYPLVLEFRTATQSVKLTGSYVQVLRLHRVLENEGMALWDKAETNCVDGEFESMDIKLRSDFNYMKIEEVLALAGYAGQGVYDYLGADFKCVFVGPLDKFKVKRRGNKCFFTPY